MNFKLLLPCLLVVYNIAAKAQMQENKSLFNQDSLKLISSQFKFTEGASVDKKGNVFFTDQPNNTIWKYGFDGKLSLFTAKAGRANGTYFDKKGNLIACADENFQILSFDKNANAKVLYQNPKTSNLNGPNDLWIGSKGDIYFTDPYYQRGYWARKSPEIIGEKVYFLKANQQSNDVKTLVVEDGLQKPNGIVGTPDGKTLYVADAQGNKTYQYDILNDGSLANKKLLINKGSDGMTLDAQGNLYLTGNGVTIFNKNGQQIGHIKVSPENTSNVCFGGKKKNILFITSGKSIYTIPMLVNGIE